jgi:hypothetical protein
MIILASTGPVISVRRRCECLPAAARNLPVAFADVPGFRQEVRHFAGVDPRLASDPCLQQFLAAAFAGPVQFGHQTPAHQRVRMVS